MQNVATSYGASEGDFGTGRVCGSCASTSNSIPPASAAVLSSMRPNDANHRPRFTRKPKCSSAAERGQLEGDSVESPRDGVRGGVVVVRNDGKRQSFAVR